MSLFDTGVRPAIDAYLKKKSEEQRDYGEYWSASSAGYCMRKVIFDRLKVPHVKEDERKTRVFEAGHIFHEWLQGITKDAGLSIASEVELQDEELMIRGHFDDLVLVPTGKYEVEGLTKADIQEAWAKVEAGIKNEEVAATPKKHLILYDYKTVHSRSFHWSKKNGSKLSYYHRLQLATYMYMLRKQGIASDKQYITDAIKTVDEARTLKISKDDLCMEEQQLLWSEDLEFQVTAYWERLNEYWKQRKLPECTCKEQEGGFMAKEQYNPYFYKGEPCSLEWLQLKKKEGVIK